MFYDQESLVFGADDYIKLETNKRLHQIGGRGTGYCFDSVLFAINEMAVRHEQKSIGDWLTHFRTQFTAKLRQAVAETKEKVPDSRLMSIVERALITRKRLKLIYKYLYKRCWKPAESKFILYLFSVYLCLFVTLLCLLFVF